ncbi:MAG: TlpA family protein disulfide reductase [Gammaproteobacteria bacterium]|nr:TlpA family protein disulfide reductase [Gammaproteobacteria bacterium]
MNKAMGKVSLIALLCAALLAPLGVRAAGVEVQSLDGRRAGLGEFLAKDKWTLVMVWTTYCGACLKQYPLISEFHNKHKDKDAAVLGVSLDGFGESEKVKTYQGAHQQNFPSVLADPDDFIAKYQRTTGEKFTGTPTYLLYDAKGSLRAYIDGLVSTADIEGYIKRPN